LKLLTTFIGALNNLVQSFFQIMLFKDHKVRVLVISHNSFSDTQSNGKTLSAFFKNWDRENLAQLYFTASVPDFTVCQKYFRITDFDILKGIAFKGIHGGRIENERATNIVYNKKGLKSFYFDLFNRYACYLFRLLRDVIWRFVGFESKMLTAFIDEFNPQVVFFQSSSGTFAFSIVKWVCQTRNIPLVMQTTDDYVTGKLTLSPFFWIHHFHLKKAYKWAVSYADCVIAIGDKMAHEYKIRFGGNYYVAMNSIQDPRLPAYVSGTEKIRFLYAGNLGLNRWKVLSLIAVCLEELYLEEKLFGELSIYSLIEPNNDVLNYLNVNCFSQFRGSLDTDDLNREKSLSDILVHVESFDTKSKHITRLSVSTKIPEYLISKRCILAVGPSDVASMEYLAKNDLAVIVNYNNKSKIKSALKKIIIDEQVRIKYSIIGFEHAILWHDADLTSKNIDNIISKAVSRPK